MSHCGFLMHMLCQYTDGFSSRAQDELLREFNNAELRTFVLSDFEGSTLHDSTWFQGGKDYKMGSQRDAQ